MEAVCDWDALLLAHNGNALKEYIGSTYESCDTKSEAVAFCNGILQSCSAISPTQYSLGLRLSTLRWMFASMPKLLYSHLIVPSQTIQWLVSCADPDSSPSLRGVALLVISLMLKANITSAASIAPAAVAKNLRDITKLMSAQPQGAAAPVRTQDILLHQCAEVLTLCDPKSSHCVSLLSGGLHDACVIVIEAAGESAPMQTRLDSCKVFICVTEIAKHHPASGVSDVSEKDAVSVADGLLTIVSRSSLLHDCFHIAYEAAVQLHKSIGAWNSDRIACLVNAVLNSMGSLRRAAAEEVLSVLDIRRMECFIGFVSSIFDECSQSPDVQVTQLASLSINEIASSMEVLKKAVRGSGSAKDARTAASDVRKGFIAMANSVYTACPAAIAADPPQFWEVSLKLLNTPLLFSCAYIACSQDDSVVSRIVANVSQGLSQVQRYSFAAACDVTTSAEELCRCGCVSMLQCADAVIAAINTPPKLSDGKSHNKEKFEWRRQVLELLRAMLGLANSSKTELDASFVLHVTEMCVRDITLLRTCLGTSKSTSGDAAAGAAAEKQRRAAAAQTQEDFGTSKPEKLVSLLRLVTESMCDLLDCSATPISPQVAIVLTKLLSNTARDATRSLLFEDDAVQLGADVELVAKIVSRLDGVDVATLRSGAQELLTALALCSSDSFMLGDTHKKILCENLCVTLLIIVRAANSSVKLVESIEKCASAVETGSYKDITKYVRIASTALDK